MVKVDMDDFPIKGAMKIDIDDLGADSNDDWCFPKNPQSQEIPQYDAEDHDAFHHLGNVLRLLALFPAGLPLDFSEHKSLEQ